MSDLAPTPETDAYIGEQNEGMMTEGEFAMCEFARMLERDRNALREERDSLLRHPDISECAKGHRFRTIASHPAKNEREWECPHCAVQEREQLRRESAAMRVAIREAFKSLEDWHLLWKDLPHTSTRAFLDGRSKHAVAACIGIKLQPFTTP